MKRILLALATAAIAFAAQAQQHMMVCEPEMIVRGNGNPERVPAGSKRLPISVSAFNLITATETFTGNGVEQFSEHGTYWTYREAATGNMAMMLFTRNGRAMLTVRMSQQNISMMLQCRPV